MLLVLVALPLWPAAASAQLTVRRIPIKTNDLVYDPHSARVYASVPQSEENGNCVAVIDPATATVVTFIPVGSEPNQLAVSDDGQYLYVGLDGDGSIRVIDLPSLTPVQEFSLGMDGPYLRQAEDIAVQPGHNDVVAVIAWGVRVFEGGVQRSRVTSTSPDTIAFDSGGVALHGTTGGYHVATYRIDADGVTELGDVSEPPPGMQLTGGLLYSSGGQVFDSARFEILAQLPGVTAGLPVILDTPRSAVAYVTRENASHPNADVLVLFDTRTFLPVGRYALSGFTFERQPGAYAGASLGSGRLVFQDDTQVAFLTLPDTPLHVLRVTLAGTGTGSVTGVDARISCGVTCSDFVAEGTLVELTATPAEGATFDGWSGDEDCVDGAVTMTTARWCTANFSSSTSLLSMRRIPVGGEDLVLNPTTGHLLVSASGSEPSLGNSIVEVDPTTGEIARHTWVAGNLGRLGLGDDGRTLHIVHSVSSAIFRLDLETAERKRYDLGRWNNSPRGVVDLAVQPGHPGVVAVSDYLGRLAILDDGVKRAVEADVKGNSYLEFGGAPDVLYAYNYGNTEAGLRRITVTATGATASKLATMPVSFGGDLHYMNGLIYQDNGYVVDPAGNVTRKFSVGQDWVDNEHAAFDQAANRAYFLVQEGGTHCLWAFDLRTGAVVWTTSFETPEDDFWDDRRLVSLGGNRIAFLTSKALYLVDLQVVEGYRLLNLSRTGRGQGVVSSSAGLDCGYSPQCSGLLPQGSVVTLNASPYESAIFAGWEGDADCSDGVVTMTSGRSCRARFVTTRTAGDIDGDGRADLVLWNSALGVWTQTNWWGETSKSTCASCKGSVAVIGDYDADEKADLATWRAATGAWYLPSLSRTIIWGNGSVGDIPVPADYDGDGRTDLAVWRPGNGTWYLLLSSKGYATTASLKIQWGANGDKPVPGDYDGDRKGDLAVWRPATGKWHLLLSSTNYAPASSRAVQWGSSAVRDRPVQGDYDGDGKCDLAVWRPGNGTWYILRSSLDYASTGAQRIQYGNQSLGDVPAPADFDGDRKLDPVVWRASTGAWHILPSASWAGGTRSVKPTSRGGVGDTPARDYR